MKTSDPRRLASGLLVVLLLVLVSLPMVGCGKKKIENPYEPVSLVQAVSGDSQNKLFKFELTDTKILAVEGKLALLSDEDRLEFLVADDLSLLSTLDSGYKLGVRREWGMNPDVYLILEHVIDGPDTSFVTADEPAVFPTFTNLAAFDRSAYVELKNELRGMSESDRSSLMRAYGKQGSKIWIDGDLSRAEASGQMNYYLTTSIGKFQLEGVNALGEVFLKAVLATDGKTTVCGPLGEVYRRSQQRDTGILGPLTLEHFQFQNYMITNG